jgi:hypothetical protein
MNKAQEYDFVVVVIKENFLYLSPALSFQEREKNRKRKFFIDSCLRRNDKFPLSWKERGLGGEVLQSSYVL